MLSWLGLSFAEKITLPLSGLIPFALYMMKQRLVMKTTQVLGVGLCAFLLLFTLMLLRDLGSTMNAYSRKHDGNVLVTQATTEQMTEIQNMAALHDFQVRQSKPYVYAQLTAINSVLLEEFTTRPSESLATLQSAIRLHWSEQIPSNNRVIKGQWWTKNNDNWRQISVEQEVMTDLGLALGDTLSFVIGQQQETFTLVASHVYQTGSGSITFWVQMPAIAKPYIHANAYAMASLELKPEQFGLLATLWQKYPTLRMVSLNELTARYDRTLTMATTLVSGFASVICLMAIVVILSSIRGIEASEKKKNSVIMSFGLNRKTCLQLNLIEWLFTAACAAIGAVFTTYLAGMLIYQSQFSLVYSPNFAVLGSTVAIILCCVTLLGIMASKNSLAHSIRKLFTD